MKIGFLSIRKSIVGALLALAAIYITTTIPSAAFASSELTEPAREINVQIEAGKYEIIEEDGAQSIRMEGYSTIQSPGDPALPEKILEFQVPGDIDWSTLKLSLEVQESGILEGSYNIAPNPSLILHTEEYWGEGKNIVNGRNMNVYGENADFPEDSLKELPYTVRKVPLRIKSEDGKQPKTAFETAYFIRIAYRPFLYNPVTQQLTLNSKVSVKATYQRSGAVASILTNGAGSYDYVVITTNQIVSNSEKLGNFIHLKELQGYTPKVVTETDFGGLTGQYPNGQAEKIRQWLINNYITLGIDYVLLIGDPDPDDPLDPVDHVGDIPMKYAWTLYYSNWKCWHSASYRGTPTDLFYADLTGNWDLDGDGLYGEGLDLVNPPSPYPGDAGFDDGAFSVVWSGQIEFDVATTYEFHTLSDDGVELWIDSIKVIDYKAADDEPRNNFGSINKTAGKYDIVLKYYAQNSSKKNSVMKLWWKTPDLEDGDPGYIGNEIVPGDHLYDSTPSASVGGLSALYYSSSDFSGTLNHRKDGQINFNWATGDRGAGGPDVGADVYVGRIPVYDADYVQLDSILEKIIRYETASASGIAWRDSALLAMDPLSDSTPAYHYGEEVKDDTLDPAGFASYRIYHDDYSGSGGPTPDDYPSTVAKVKAEWENGYGLVTWWTHGSRQGASHIFNSGSTVDLDDSKPAFTYQATCLNGYPEDNNNLGYALLKNGAVATISATRVSFGSRGAWTYDPTSSANPNFGYKYIDHIINSGYAAGPAFYAAKGTVVEADHNEMNYNLNGDPTTYFLTTTPNEPPTADANGPYTGNEGSPITFNASGSHDPEADTLQYRWDFDNDGTWDTAWMSSPTVTHTYCDNVTGSVKVEVRDGLGFTDTDTASVTINNVAPSVDAGADQTVDEGDTVSFSGSFTDPGTCDTHTFSWDFGDGSSVLFGTLTPTHAYGDNGMYTVTLTVTDDDGGVGVDTLQVTVSNVAPTVTSISMGQPNPQFILPIVHTVDFEGNFTDPGWLDTHTSTWDFGDGVIVSGTVTEENVKPDATGTSTASHVYSEPGTYTVIVTVTDDDGGSDNETMQVVVVTAEEAKHDINDYIQGLPDSAFKGNPVQRKKAFDNMFYAIDDMLADKEYQGAINHLQNNIRDKVDGDGKGDWITDPAAQAELLMKIDDLVAYLEYLKTL